MLLKQLVAAFMLLCVMAQTFSNTLIVADYYINTDAFAANCENKDKPLLHCNGQCQMSRQLEKENKKDQTNPDRKSENKLDVFIVKNEGATLLLQSLIVTKNFPHTDTGKPVNKSADIFHPPCLA